ncbi:phage portal protein [Candidatus Kaiserbacteria bacterium]|nr:phage portal protein [Candidatus Kaiserbacteria bacterium]
MAAIERIKDAWNAFRYSETKEKQEETFTATSQPSAYRPDRVWRSHYNDKSIVSAIYNRLAIDVATIDIKHIRVDELGRYKEDVDSGLNQCLTLEANLDQAPRAFRQDIAETLFDKGAVAIVPIDTAANPTTGEPFDIYNVRVGEIVNWYPRHVRVSVYNEKTGKREEITLEKSYLAIAYNPLYTIMNERNSTLQRLIRKLQILDVIDEQSGSGKLDLIVQLPYAIKTETKKNQAENRRADLESQLKGSQYGIAYTDATEKIIQLNRPAENNLMAQIEYLVHMLYGQLGLTEEIMNGTADEATMLNYYNRTIEPIVSSIVEAMQRSFLTNSGRQKRDRIKYFRDPFKLVPVNQIAEIADKFTRNEIFTANEIRGFMGVPPSSDPKADKLMNSNMPQKTAETPESTGTQSLERTPDEES